MTVVGAGALDIAVIDVGHGNCAVIEDDGYVTVIDAGLGRTIIDVLRQRDIRRVDTVLVSHSDADHVGGLLTLLLDKDISVGTVYCNSDGIQRSRTWTQLVYVFEDVAERKGTTLQVALTDTTRLAGGGAAQIHVLAPPAWRALTGPGTRSRRGTTLSGNSLSAVIRVSVDGVPLALFAGDLDHGALSDLLNRNVALQAQLLVFPHHGGLPSDAGDATDFARKLCEAVQPSVVVFSTGRGKWDNPRPEVVDGVRAAVPDAHIMCTELSKACAPDLPGSSPAHLSGRIARGASRRACCGGTIVLDPRGADVVAAPRVAAHGAFVDSAAPAALCRNRHRPNGSGGARLADRELVQLSPRSRDRSCSR